MTKRLVTDEQLAVWEAEAQDPEPENRIECDRVGDLIAQVRALLPSAPAASVEAREQALMRAALLGGPLGDQYGRDYAKLPEYAREQIDGYEEAIREGVDRTHPRPDAAALAYEQAAKVCEAYCEEQKAKREAFLRGDYVHDAARCLAAMSAADNIAARIRALSTAASTPPPATVEPGRETATDIVRARCEQEAAKVAELEAEVPRDERLISLHRYSAALLRTLRRRVAAVGPPPTSQASVVERIVAELRERAAGGAVTLWTAAVLREEADRIEQKHGGRRGE